MPTGTVQPLIVYNGTLDEQFIEGYENALRLMVEWFRDNVGKVPEILPVIAVEGSAPADYLLEDPYWLGIADADDAGYPAFVTGEILLILVQGIANDIPSGILGAIGDGGVMDVSPSTSGAMVKDGEMLTSFVVGLGDPYDATFNQDIGALIHEMLHCTGTNDHEDPGYNNVEWDWWMYPATGITPENRALLQVSNFMYDFPQPGLHATAEQVADALSGRYGAVDTRFRFERVTRTNEFIDDISSAVLDPGTVQHSNMRAVMRAVQVEFDADALPADFNFGADIVRVTEEIFVRAADEWVEIPWGLFILDLTETRYIAGKYPAGGRRVLVANGADLTMILLRSIRSDSYRVPAGSLHLPAVSAIMDRHGLMYTWPESYIRDTGAPLDWVWPAGTSEWKIITDLMYGIGHYAPWVNSTGVFTSRWHDRPYNDPTAVVYRDTAEPKMITLDDVVVQLDRKAVNRVVIIREDPRYGYASDEASAMVRENASLSAVNSTASLAFNVPVEIVSSAPGDPALITTATDHGFGSEANILILGHTGSDKEVNGTWPITVISPTTFTIPRVLTLGGSGGTAQPTLLQTLELKGDSEPSTRCVINELTGGDLASFELRWAAILSRRATLTTFADPRRGAHETYELDIAGVTDTYIGTRFRALGWSRRLEAGAPMQHEVALLVDVPDEDIYVHSGQQMPGEA